MECRASKIEEARRRLARTQRGYSAWLKRAREARASGDRAQAMNALKEALRLCPDAEEARSMVAEIRRERSYRAGKSVPYAGPRIPHGYKPYSRRHGPISRRDAGDEALWQAVSWFVFLVGAPSWLWWAFTGGWIWCREHPWILVALCIVLGAIGALLNERRTTPLAGALMSHGPAAAIVLQLVLGIVGVPLLFLIGVGVAVARANARVSASDAVVVCLILQAVISFAVLAYGAGAVPRAHGR